MKEIEYNFSGKYSILYLMELFNLIIELANQKKWLRVIK